MLVSDYFPPRHNTTSDPASPINAPPRMQWKGKGKESDSQTPFSWIKDFLRSLIPESIAEAKAPKESAFPQALAKAMNFCFAEMQHERWTSVASATAAQCGLEVRTQAAHFHIQASEPYSYPTDSV